MNKKKVLFTSLAALTLASLQAQTFAEEVDAGVTDGLVVETYVSDPEVDAPTMAEPVSETTESTGFLGLPASTLNEISRQLSGVSETAVAEPVVEANQAAPAMDVQAIANGDYSSVEGNWVNDKGETIEITENPTPNFDNSRELADVVVGTQVSADGSAVEYSNFKIYFDNGEFRAYGLGDGYSYARIFIPAGTEFNGQNYLNISPDVKFVAEQDTVLLHYRGGTTLASYNDIAEKLYKRQVVASPVEESTPVVTDKAGDSTPEPAQPSPLDAFLAGDFSAIAGEWATADGKIIEISSTGEIKSELNKLDLKALQGFDSNTISFSPSQNGKPVAGTGFSYVIDTDEFRISAAVAFAVPDIYKRVSSQASTAIDTVPTAPVTEKEVAVSPFADYVGTWQAPAGDRLTISDKGILTFAGKDYPLSLRDGKLTAGEITGRFGFAYDAVKDAIYLGINGLGFNPAGLSAEKLAEAKKWREDREYFYRVVKPEAGQVTTATPLQPSAQQELAQAPVSAPVHVPLAVKSDASAPVKPTYSRVEAAKQAEATQTGLPNTGDVTSLLGVIGASLSALGLAGLRRRK